jgi:hypothetical protein
MRMKPSLNLKSYAHVQFSTVHTTRSQRGLRGCPTSSEIIIVTQNVSTNARAVPRMVNRRKFFIGK